MKRAQSLTFERGGHETEAGAQLACSGSGLTGARSPPARGTVTLATPGQKDNTPRDREGEIASERGDAVTGRLYRRACERRFRCAACACTRSPHCVGRSLAAPGVKRRETAPTDAPVDDERERGAGARRPGPGEAQELARRPARGRREPLRRRAKSQVERRAGAALSPGR